MPAADYALKMAYEIEVVLKFMRAVKQISAQQLQAERRLTRKIEGLFGETLDAILRQFGMMDSVPGDIVRQKALLQRLFELEPELASTLESESRQVGQYGKNRVVSKLQQSRHIIDM